MYAHKISGIRYGNTFAATGTPITSRVWFLVSNRIRGDTQLHLAVLLHSQD